MEGVIVTHISRDQATLSTKYNGRSQRRLASDQNSMGVEITVGIDVKVGRERADAWRTFVSADEHVTCGREFPLLYVSGTETHIPSLNFIVAIVTPKTTSNGSVARYEYLELALASTYQEYSHSARTS